GSLAALGGAVLLAWGYRRRANDDLTPVGKAPLWLELGWALGLLTLFVVFWVIGFTLYMRIEVPPAKAMDLYVTGQQWMWKFEYPDGRSSISDLVVPAGRAVRLIMTSRDVIHSFYVPAFRMKQDVLPGRYITAWFEAPMAGEHRIFCAEYCGTG